MGFNRVYKPISQDSSQNKKDQANIPRIAEAIGQAAEESKATIGKIRTESVEGHNIVYTQSDKRVPMDKHNFDGWTHDYTDRHNEKFNNNKAG